MPAVAQQVFLATDTTKLMKESRPDAAGDDDEDRSW